MEPQFYLQKLLNLSSAREQRRFCRYLEEIFSEQELVDFFVYVSEKAHNLAVEAEIENESLYFTYIELLEHLQVFDDHNLRGRIRFIKKALPLNEV